MLSRATVLTMLALVSISSNLAGQEDWFARPRADVGVNFILSDPVGEFDHFVGMGAGADFFGRLPMDPMGFLSLRADLGFLIYGYESQRVCFEGVGCRVQARLQTTNNIFFGGIGPELAIPLERARPYVHAFVGFSYFNTTSSLEDLWGNDSDFNTENYGDGTMSWGLGGGLEMNLRQGRVPIDLNLGFRYHRNGRVEYLTKGDIVDNPDGSVTMYPVSSEANLMAYHIGVSIGIPRGRDHY
ncbi:MAG: hypothetical protein HKO65_01130 [Gemmatimonadetes bacterium]|nr:hypothetical protein [Gemmatimonadota bacterium]